MSDQVETTTEAVSSAPETVSAADLFYPQENATTDTDSQSGTPVEAEAVEAEKSAIEESAESELDVVEEDSDTDEPLYFEIDGKEISVKDVKESLNNGLRQADYTKKTQVLAEEKKEVEAKIAKADEIFNKLNSHVEALELAFSKEEAEIDWDHLREYDTGEYLRLKEEHSNKKSLIDSAKADAKLLNEQVDNAFITSEQKVLLGMFPDWTDPATGGEAMKKDSALIQAYAESNGFTDKEYSQLKSAKVMQAIHKAAKYDALKGDSDATSKQVRKAPVAIKPSPKKATPQTQSAVELFYGKN
jgi:hypothetical protein